MIKTKSLALLFTGALLAFSTTFATAQVTPSVYGTFTNTPNVFTITNAVGPTNELVLQENTGLALACKFNSPATATDASGLWLWFSVDGTNYPVAPFKLMGAGTGTTPVVIYTNWSAAQLSGFAKLKVQLTNANANNITNVISWRRWNSPAR